MKMCCPVCGRLLNTERWFEECGCVETYSKCLKCGYCHHWSYGTTWVGFGGFDFEYSYTITEEEYFKMVKQANKARWKYRKWLLRKGIVKGKKHALNVL